MTVCVYIPGTTDTPRIQSSQVSNSASQIFEPGPSLHGDILILILNSIRQNTSTDDSNQAKTHIFRWFPEHSDEHKLQFDGVWLNILWESQNCQHQPILTFSQKYVHKEKTQQQSKVNVVSVIYYFLTQLPSLMSVQTSNRKTKTSSSWRPQWHHVIGLTPVVFYYSQVTGDRVTFWSDEMCPPISWLTRHVSCLLIGYWYLASHR